MALPVPSQPDSDKIIFQRSTMNEEACYLCPICGEEIVIPVDVTQGREQEFVEDCPICCGPVRIRLEFLDDDTVQCDASAE
jgi:hypothetical protein